MMSKKVIILFLLCLSILKVNAYSEKNLLQKAASAELIKSALILNQKWVPYPEYNDRTGWDKLMGNFKSEYIQRGEQALNYSWIVIKATDYLDFERTGTRTTMESPYGRNVQAITNLLLAELAEGKGRFIDQLINGVFYTCEMTSWSIAAHQVSQSDGRSLPLKDEHLIELTSGDVGSLFSWIYYFFQDEFDKVNPTISKRLRLELEERILEPFMVKDFWWMGFNYRPGMVINNWNVWCNFNVLQCFLLLENDKDRLVEAVAKTMRSVDQFLNYSKQDGACEEGPSYWGHAAGKMYDYLQLLYDGTGGKISIFDDPMIKNMGEYISRTYVGNDWVVNFADASAKLSLDANLIFRYGKAVQSNEMIGFANKLSKNQKDVSAPNYGRDIFRSFQSLIYFEEFSQNTAEYTTPQNTWYPETEFCYMKNNKGFFVTLKGGFNNESHNHNDVGTFSLYINEVPVFIDAGVGTYTRQTFSSERYNIWTMQSIYHNLPEINGYQQKFGTNFAAKNTIYDPKKQTFSLDISGAYPKEAGINYWKRNYVLDGEKLMIRDDYSLKNTIRKNRVHFLTWGNVENPKEGIITVNVNGQQVELCYDKNRFVAFIETIKLEDKRLSNVWGNEIKRIVLEEKAQRSNAKYEFAIIKKQPKTIL